MSKEKLYRARDIKRILGVDKNKLFYLKNTHRLIQPSTEASGSGKQDYYSVSDLIKIGQIELLLRMGFSIKATKKYLRQG